MRIAILASPRHGNNWFRRVLAETIRYPLYAEHTFEGFPTDLPDDCIINIHAVRDDKALAYLQTNGFKVVVLTRHPLDALVSAWQFARNEPRVHQWLGGRCAIPSEARHEAPNDRASIDWMCGAGAAALLSVSWSWWTSPAAEVRLRYENLLLQPHRVFAQVFGYFGFRTLGSIDQALATYSVEYFRQFNNHGWLGGYGTYARFLTSANCARIYARQKQYFDLYGYRPQADAGLSDAAATSAYFGSIA